MRSVVTSGALVALLFVSHAALAEAPKGDASSHVAKSAKSAKASKKKGAKADAKSDAKKVEASKGDLKKGDTKDVAKMEKKKEPKTFSKGNGPDDDSELVQGLDPKIAADDAREIAEEQATRQRVLAAAKAIQEKTKKPVVVAQLATQEKKDAQLATQEKKDAPMEQVHIDAVATLESAPAATPVPEAAPAAEEKSEAKDEKGAKIVVATKAETSAPLSTKISRASTHKKLQPKPPCLRPEVTITSHLGEEEHFALTRCDGSLAPGAVEHFSVALRPGSAARPESFDKIGKGTSDTIAPGIRRMDPTLVERLQLVVDHFTKSGKAPQVQVVSGFRPSSVGSYHASGRAMDFRLDGVKNEELVAFCKTLTDTGCGYYPNSVFVHMDVRDTGAGHVTWIDASGPGEKPHYVSAWPAPPSEMNRTKSLEDGLAKLDPTLPALPADDHVAALAPAPKTWGASKEADLGARAAGIEGLDDDEMK